MVFLDVPNIAAPEKKGEYGLLPKGTYRALVTDAERKATKDGTGTYISVTFDIVEGPHKGRKLWHIFNDGNKNPQAVAIAKGELKRFVEALDHTKPIQYENEFFRLIADRVLWLEVGVRKNKQSGEERNQIFDFLPDRVASTAAPEVDEIPPPDDVPF
jgi:hypothetical protein